MREGFHRERRGENRFADMRGGGGLIEWHFQALLAGAPGLPISVLIVDPIMGGMTFY